MNRNIHTPSIPSSKPPLSHSLHILFTFSFFSATLVSFSPLHEREELITTLASFSPLHQARSCCCCSLIKRTHSTRVSRNCTPAGWSKSASSLVNQLTALRITPSSWARSRLLH